jgi:hypothetical protein
MTVSSHPIGVLSRQVSLPGAGRDSPALNGWWKSHTTRNPIPRLPGMPALIERREPMMERYFVLSAIVSTPHADRKPLTFSNASRFHGRPSIRRGGAAARRLGIRIRRVAIQAIRLQTMVTLRGTSPEAVARNSSQADFRRSNPVVMASSSSRKGMRKNSL